MDMRNSGSRALHRMITLSAAALLVLLAAVGCSSSEPAAPTATRSPTTSPSPSLGANQVIVSSRANIFGAGRTEPPQPGGGGGGVLPVLWTLPAGGVRTVTFPGISGEVSPIQELPNSNGPGGDGNGPTNIESYQGISGIIHGKNGMFLVGVFLSSAAPADPAPARLDFTNNEAFTVLQPKIGQTFFIGDGAGRRFIAPPNATRLYLGFADAAAFSGKPGYYGNNIGRLTVTINATTG